MSSGDYRAETRQRILEAACEAFSESGYRGTSIRRIVAIAGTNIASVNYHFGSKEALYRAVVEKTFAERSGALGSALGDLDPKARSLQQVREVAKARIRSGLSAKTFFPPRLIGWEIVSPSFDLKKLFESRFAETESQLAAFLEPLFEPGTSAEQRAFAARWFFTVTLPPPPVVMGVRKALGPEPDDAALEQTAGRLADAAIAGVRALAAAGPADGKEVSAD